MRFACLCLLYVACSGSLVTDATDATDATDETQDSDDGSTPDLGYVFSDFGFDYAAVVDGLDLDGVSSASDAGDCPHDDYAGGADYQFRRVIEEIGEGLEEGEIVDGVIEAAVKNGSFTVLIEVTDVEDAVNDDEVTVQLHSSDDVPPLGTAGVLGGGSLTVGESVTSPAVTGSITDGVLIAGPFAFDMPLEIQLVSARLVLSDAWLRVVVGESSASGLISGFWSVDDVVAILGEPTQENGANPDDPDLPGAAGFSLNAFTDALEAHADGDFDGTSCTSISSAFAVDAQQAFLVR